MLIGRVKENGDGRPEKLFDTHFVRGELDQTWNDVVMYKKNTDVRYKTRQGIAWVIGQRPKACILVHYAQ